MENTEFEEEVLARLDAIEKRMADAETFFLSLQKRFLNSKLAKMVGL